MLVTVLNGFDQWGLTLGASVGCTDGPRERAFDAMGGVIAVRRIGTIANGVEVRYPSWELHAGVTQWLEC